LAKVQRPSSLFVSAELRLRKAGPLWLSAAIWPQDAEAAVAAAAVSSWANAGESTANSAAIAQTRPTIDFMVVASRL
jgi:hypothetical protein